MLLCFSDAKKWTDSSELYKKLTRSQKMKIANGVDKLDTILSQVNASQNLRQMIGNTHNSFQPLASIITEWLDNIQKFNLTIISGSE